MKRDLTKTVVSLFVLAAFMTLGANSYNRYDTYLISKEKDKVKDSLKEFKSDTHLILISVDSCYFKLKSLLEHNDLRDNSIRLLEMRLEGMIDKYDSLIRSFNKSESKARYFFKILKRRAKENNTEKFRRKLLRRIKKKEKSFEKQMRRTKPLLEDIRKSILKFDDIVGYCQISKGLDGVDDIIEDVVNTIEEGEELHSEIKEYIDEGLKIIGNIDSRNSICSFFKFW